MPFSSETDGYLGSSLLLATSVPFLFAGWLMKGMETWGRKKKKAEDALVHEKSKLFSYIPLTRLCFLLSSFLAPSCLFFFPFERICWMFNESLKWGCFCWFDCGFCGQFFSFFFGEIGRTEESRLRIGEVWKRLLERRFFF